MRRASPASAIHLSLTFALVSLAATAHAQPITLEDFKSATTEGIVKLCTAPQTDALHQAAIGYCVGYLTGAFHYYKAVEGAGTQPKLVCFETPEPSRREALERFVAWARAHPEYGSHLAVDSIFRFLGEAFPCSRSGEEARRP